jgi:hypothetical protein
MAARCSSVCDTRRVLEDAQFAALISIHELLDARGIEYWLFGGWAVDFHAQKVTRQSTTTSI